MRVIVLGTAAGGGVPQWNCACPGCDAARGRRELRRSHDALAVEVGEGGWLLVNAPPDLTDQLTLPVLRPAAGSRRTPVAAVAVTDAELDHTLGLHRLREADRLRLLATPTVHDALDQGLRLSGVLGPYLRLDRADLAVGTPVRVGAVDVLALPVSGKRPRYAADLDCRGGDWSVALLITDRAGGGSLLYAPNLARWPAELEPVIGGAGLVLADGTFLTDDEPLTSGCGTVTAGAMGHLPILGADGTATRLAALAPGRVHYTHLNNTNPLIDPDHPAHETLAARGLTVATEKAVIDL